MVKEYQKEVNKEDSDEASKNFMLKMVLKHAFRGGVRYQKQKGELDGFRSSLPDGRIR